MSIAPGCSRAQDVGPDQPARVRAEREVDGQDVGDVGDRLRRRGHGHRSSRGSTRGHARRGPRPGSAPKRRDQTTMSSPNACARRRPPGRCCRSPGSRASARTGLAARANSFLFHSPSAELRDVVRDPSIDGEDEAERELRDGDRVLARAVGDVDPTRRRRGNVDRVVAGTGADDQPEVPGVEHLGRHLGRPDDEDLGARLGQRGDERLVLEGSVVDDLATCGPQAIETR